MKAFICCTQTKPYLISMGKDTKGVEMFQIIFDKKDWSKDEKYLNGSIVAECEVNEAFFLKGFDGVKYAENPLMHEHETLGHRHCLTEKELASYGKGKTLYCYHLENVKPVELKLSEFYEDKACEKSLTKAPKGYRYAYSIVECEKSEAHFISSRGDKVYYSKAIKCLIFSMHSETCINILSLKCDLIPLTIRIAEGVTFK